MRKLVKKAVALLGISVLTVGLLAGCGKSDAGKDKDKVENGSSVEGNETGNDEEAKKLKIGVVRCHE